MTGKRPIAGTNSKGSRREPLYTVLTALFILSLATAGLYYFWITSPFYAFQEVVSAAQNHDLKLFKERFDLDGFVDSLLNDLLVYPAATTPGLNHLQREVSDGAVALAKLTIASELITKIEQFISTESTSRDVGWTLEQPVFAKEGNDTRDNFMELLHVATQELVGEAGKLKRIVYARMQQYASLHPTTIPGRLLGSRGEQRAPQLLALRQEFGLFPQNFRGISSYNVAPESNGESCKIGFSFFSEKVRRPITLEVELTRADTVDYWRIRRISNVSRLLAEAGEDYENDVHTLMATSLTGISNDSVKTEVRGMADRIKGSEAAQSLMKKWKIKF